MSQNKSWNKKLSTKQKRKIANDALHWKRRARGGDTIMIRPNYEQAPAPVKHYKPDDNGNLVLVSDK